MQMAGMLSPARESIESDEYFDNFGKAFEDEPRENVVVLDLEEANVTDDPGKYSVSAKRGQCAS